MAMSSQKAAWPDLDGVVEVVVCTDSHSGGRESGKDASVGSGDPGRLAAAKPAACPNCGKPLQSGLRWDGSGKSCLCERTELNERIRALEAELAELEAEANECMRAQALAAREREEC